MDKPNALFYSVEVLANGKMHQETKLRVRYSAVQDGTGTLNCIVQCVVFFLSYPAICLAAHGVRLVLKSQRFYQGKAGAA